MKARVQKWGNSLALRIPKSFAQEARLAENREVDISLVRGKLVVSIRETGLTLGGLLGQVTPENLHGEVSTGTQVGDEEW